MLTVSYRRPPKLGADRLQPEAFVQLADQNQAGVQIDARSLKRDLQKAVEGELQRLGFFFFLTHRVSPSVAECLASEPRKIRRDAYAAGHGTTTKSEIRA